MCSKAMGSAPIDGPEGAPSQARNLQMSMIPPLTGMMHL